MTRAPTRLWRRGAAVLGCSCMLVLRFGTGTRADDDWSLTRPAARSSRAPAADPLSGKGAAMRALTQALARPFDPGSVQSLFSVYRQRDGDLQQLERELGVRATAKQPRRAALVLLAKLQAELGNLDGAREFYARATELQADAGVLRAWALLEHGAGRLSEERALLERALQSDEPKAARVQLLGELGTLVLELGDYGAAADHFAAAARANPGSLAHALAFARALSARGAHAQAADAYAAVVETVRGDPRILPSLLLELARLQLAAARTDDALATLRRAQRLVSPGTGLHAELREQLFDVHRRLGRLAELARELSTEHSPDTVALLARVYEQLDQPTEALAALRRVIARQPYDVASAERVIALLWQQGRVEEVIAEYQRLVRVAPHEARFAAELCQLLFQAGRRGEALTMLAKLGRDNPRDVRLHETIVDLYARFHEAEAAHRELQLLAKLEPSDPERFVTLGEAELARGRKDAARAAFARVSQGRHTLTAHMRLAQIYLDHEFPNEALAEYDQAQKLRPNDAHVARGRAEVLARLFRYKDAVSEWQRALSLAATDQQLRHDARKELVGLWDELAELKGHVMELEQLCGSSTASSPAPQAPACESEQARTLVEAYERMARHGGARAEPARQLRAAEDMLTRIVRAEPRDLESLLALERLRVKRGDLDGAIAVLEQLTHADPDNERLYLERMVGYALSRYRDDDAARYAQRAVASAPDDPVAHEHLGDLYRARNDLSRALTSYERALALDPTRFGLAWRIAQHEIAIGDAAAAELRLRSVVRGSQDDDLVLRALRSALQLGLSETHLVELEREVLPLALLEPPRAVYRRALLELYAVLVPRLAQRTAGAEPDAGLARSELSAIGRRAAKPLLAALADPDVSQARESIALLAVVGNPSAAQALVALAERGADLELRRDALRVAAVLGGDELAPHLVALARVKEARLQAVAVWGLARGQSQATAAALAAIAVHPAPVLRSYALLGLARRATPEAYGLLHEALIHDRSPFVRVSAALGLGMLGDPAAGEALASCSAQTHEPALAEAATLSLGLLADARTSSVLATRLFSSDARVRSAADLALRALEHGKRLQFEPPLQLDRNELSSVLLAARETLAAAATNDLTRYARELRTAAGEALRGDDANKLAVLSFLAHAGPTPPAVGANDPRELAVDLRAALLPELFALRALPDRALRVALVQALSNARSHDADALLMDLAQDRDVEVRGPALTALGAQPLSERPGWADRLSRMALTEAAFWLRQRAVLALARLPSAAATRTLARVLSTDAYALVRESAAQSLAGRDASVAGPTLLAALRDPEPRVSAAAARALSSTGGEALRAARSDNELAPALRQLLLR